MLSAADTMQLLQSLIWLLAGVGVFIVGMRVTCRNHFALLNTCVRRCILRRSPQGEPLK